MSNKQSIFYLEIVWGQSLHSYKIYPGSTVKLILETENSFHITFEDSSTELVINKHCLVMWETKRTQPKGES